MSISLSNLVEKKKVMAIFVIRNIAFLYGKILKAFETMKIDIESYPYIWFLGMNSDRQN